LDIVELIAENKIREAISNGEFDNLPGKGKPIKVEDLSRIPEELRSAYLVLKNAGVLPEEIQLKKEIASIKDLLKFCSDNEESSQLKKKLNEKMLRFNMLMERRKLSSTKSISPYLGKVRQRFGE